MVYQRHTHFLIAQILMVMIIVPGGLTRAQSVEEKASLCRGGPFTLREATKFVERAEAELETLAHHEERAAFLNYTDETLDHARLKAEASKIAAARGVAFAKEAACFDGQELPDDVKRKLARMKLAVTVPAPDDPTLSQALSDYISTIETNYTSAASCSDRSPCRPKEDLYNIISTSTDPVELLAAWNEWRSPARAIRESYQQMVEIANKGARELNYADVGALWRSHYDMPPDAFRDEYQRLWDQVQPLYNQLHCHVRARLREQYGEIVPEHGLIPAHLLGNMWAQYWTAIDSRVGPGSTGERISITKLLEEKRFTPRDMVRTGESFFNSLGFSKLPGSFWDRSMLIKPEDRKVNCQGYASPIDPAGGDVRMKMCIKVNEKDFYIIHHELGHIYYYLSYANQPYLFQDGANPGFHEAIGDAVALSITPKYLKTIGLLDNLPDEAEDLAYLFRTALDKIPRMAMSIVIDQWRWKVFKGEIRPDRYNEGWWDLRQSYQGLSPPVPRTDADFDAGMFYHVSYNVPYDRYFVAQILQFDFHRALCDAAGNKEALHRCSIYGNREAGKRLAEALALGASWPWPDVLEKIADRRQIDASSVVKYFEPVMAWLKQQNQGRQCGW